MDVSFGVEVQRIDNQEERKMEWKYVKTLSSADNINEFECLVKYAFPDDFRNCILSNNGGRPGKRVFDTNRNKERVLKSFLSFNKEDRETVWKIQDWNKEELSDRYIPFAIDNFGNLICFDAENDKVVFLELEYVTVEQIADNFTEFMSKLYE